MKNSKSKLFFTIPSDEFSRINTLDVHKSTQMADKTRENIAVDLDLDFIEDNDYSYDGSIRSFTDEGINSLLTNKDTKEIRSIGSFPISRVQLLGQGSSSVVYKSVMLHNLGVCAEKVIRIHDKSKRYM